VFRDANERTAALASEFEARGSGFLPDEMSHTFICECATLGCTEPLTLTLASYARARTNPDAFLVASGHESLDHERVIANIDGCLVVVPSD
jgi:hypothetical protein